jgi:hypothetical protein
MIRWLFLTFLITFVFWFLVTPIVKSEPDSFSFTFAGDYGNTFQTQAVLSSLNPRNSGASFHLALGDLSYGKLSPEEAWCDKVKQSVGDDFPFEILAGNHEANEPKGNNIDNFVKCLPDKIGNIQGFYGREYYFDYPLAVPMARFILVSPGLTFGSGSGNYPSGFWNYNSEGSSHYQWVSKAIDEARSQGIEWIVVGYHLVCLETGEKKGCDAGEKFMNLLAEKKVDLVLQAHDHTYQRTKQLSTNPSDCPLLSTSSYNSRCVADADDDLVKGAGTVFLTVGTGGYWLYNVDRQDPKAAYFAAMMGANANPTWGFGKATIREDSLTYSFVRAAGGDFKDAFTISQEEKDLSAPSSQKGEEIIAKEKSKEETNKSDEAIKADEVSLANSLKPLLNLFIPILGLIVLIWLSKKKEKL